MVIVTGHPLLKKVEAVMPISDDGEGNDQLRLGVLSTTGVYDKGNNVVRGYDWSAIADECHLVDMDVALGLDIQLTKPAGGSQYEGFNEAPKLVVRLHVSAVRMRGPAAHVAEAQSPFGVATGVPAEADNGGGEGDAAAASTSAHAAASTSDKPPFEWGW